MGSPKYGNQTHFVKWDEEKQGGRWYECTLGEKMSDGKFPVWGHGGWEGNFYGHDITPIGVTPNIGDEVIFIGPRCTWGPIYGSSCL